MALKVDHSTVSFPGKVAEVQPSNKESLQVLAGPKSESSSLTSAATSPKGGILRRLFLRLLQLCNQIPLLGRLSRWLQQKFGSLPKQASPTPSIVQTTTQAPPSNEQELHLPNSSLFTQSYARQLKEKLKLLLSEGHKENNETIKALNALIQSLVDYRALKEQLFDLSTHAIESVDLQMKNIEPVMNEGSLKTILEAIQKSVRGDSTDPEILTERFNEMLVLSCFARVKQKQSDDFLERTLRLIRTSNEEEKKRSAHSLWNDIERLSILPNITASEADLCSKTISRYADLPIQQGNWEAAGIELCHEIKTKRSEQIAKDLAYSNQKKAFIESSSLSKEVIEKAFMQAKLERRLDPQFTTQNEAHLTRRICMNLFDSWDARSLLSEASEVARCHLNLERARSVSSSNPSLTEEKTKAIANLLAALPPPKEGASHQNIIHDVCKKFASV